MEINILDIILVISIIVNFVLLKTLSANTDQRIKTLYAELDSTKSKVEKNEEFINNINFHHTSLTQSVIYHLHASGTAHMNRVWQTYQIEVKNEWPQDKQWPDYLAIDGNPKSSPIKVSEGDYKHWQKLANLNEYTADPKLIINYDYVYDMDKW